MAFPIIKDTFTGVETLDALHHEITLPSGINYGDLIVIFCSVIGSPETDLGYGTGCGINIVDYVSSSNWKIDNGYGTYITNNCICLLYAIALGSGSDYVTIRSQSWYSNSLYNKFWDVLCPCRLSYVGYIISGHGVTSSFIKHLKTRTTAGGIGNWILKSCPETDDSISDDYLYLIGVSSTYDDIAITQPSNFTDLITAQGANVATGTSVSSCRREYAFSQHPSVTFVSAPFSTYDGMILRIPSGSGSSYSGFGIYIYRNSIGLT